MWPLSRAPAPPSRSPPSVSPLPPTGRSSSRPRASSWSTTRWTPPPIRRPCSSVRPTSRRCWTWSSAPARARSCRAPWSSVPTSASAGPEFSWRWRGSGCTRPAGPRSAASAPTSRSGGRGSRPASSGPWPTESRSGARLPSCTPPGRTPQPSGSTSPSASPCAAGRPSCRRWSRRTRCRPRRQDPGPRGG